MDTDKGEMAKARTTPHESKTRPMPEPNVCAECGLSPWDDIHIRPSQARTAKAREARRLNVLRRKTPEYVAALRELGYTVVPPLNTASVEYEGCGCIRNSAGAHRRGCES